MDVVRRLISVAGAFALAVSLIGLGFLVCIAPFTTNGLSNMFADDASSPFDRSQLVQVANATRDYSFGNHDVLELYQTIADVDRSYQDSIEKSGGKVGSSFPNLRNITSDSTEAQYRAVFRNASDVYCYTEGEITHLDDCYYVFLSVIPVLILAFVITIGCLVAVGVMGKRRHLGGVLMAGTIGVVVLLVLIGAWALIDFNGFFASFHTFFFAQGTWSFPANSLLICALPQGFWTGMGVVWLLTTLVGSFVGFIIGRLLRGKKKRSK